MHVVCLPDVNYGVMWLQVAAQTAADVEERLPSLESAVSVGQQAMDLAEKKVLPALNNWKEQPAQHLLHNHTCKFGTIDMQRSVLEN